MAEPTYDELKAQLAALQDKVKTRERRAIDFKAKAKGRQRGEISFKVSEKGGVSVYGLGRFPVTLYYEQWVRLLDQADQLRAFLEENKPSLKLKQPEA
jgi:hypothetical protein